MEESWNPITHLSHGVFLFPNLINIDLWLCFKSIFFANSHTKRREKNNGGLCDL